MSGSSGGVGLLGLGAVGSGVYSLLQDRNLGQELGVELSVRRVAVRKPGKPRPVTVDPARLTADPEAVVLDPEVAVVVEVMGALEPAGSCIRRALSLGKSVITANKELVAASGPELRALARRHGCQFRFEASVGGGIPIVAALEESLAANRILAITGILNGTTNYILSLMSETGAGFESALERARSLGYAEADPTADISGLDAAAKLCILTWVGMGSTLKPDQIRFSGIAGISARDIACARDLGHVIKLLGIASGAAGGPVARVGPHLVPVSHPLAAVSGARNAIIVTGDVVGDATFLGEGAGQLPTASAVVGDLLAVVRGGTVATVAEAASVPRRQAVPVPVPPERAPFYIRLLVAAAPGAMAGVTGALAEAGVGMRRLFQTGQEVDGDGTHEWVLITEPALQQSLDDALCVIAGLPGVRELCSTMPVLTDTTGI